MAELEPYRAYYASVWLEAQPEPEPNGDEPDNGDDDDEEDF